MGKRSTVVKFKPDRIRGSATGGRLTSLEIDAVKKDASAKLQHLVNDFKNKVNRWKPSLRSFGAAFYQAHHSVEKTLKAHQENLKAQQDLMFSALGLVCGASLNWVGYALKNTNRYTESALKAAIKDNIVGHVTDAFKWGADQGLKSVQSSLKINVPSFGLSPKDFETQIENKFDDQVNALEAFLVGKDKKVLFDDTWAEWVYWEKGEGNKAKAFEWINGWYKYLEREWCQKVVYYRRKPNLPQQVTMERIIERSMWAKYLTQKINITPYRSHSGMSVSFYTSDAIENRLVELGMMKAADRSDRKRLAEAKKSVKERKGTWTAKPTLTNPEDWTTHDDMVKMGRELKKFRPQRIGNLSTPVSSQKKPGREP